MSTSDRISILLVDDRPENLISLAAILDSPDYKLVEAASGSEALRALMQEEFALILMDVQMPGMDGFETANLIKKRDRTKHIPIIFITANSTEERFVFQGYSVGAVDYILKPANPNVLRSKVAVFAELHRKTKALLRQAEIERANERLQREKDIARLEVENLRHQQRAAQRYRALVESIQGGIVWAADPLTRALTFVSRQSEKLLGYDPGLWLREPELVRNCIHPDDFDLVARQLASLTPAGGEAAFECRLVARSGRVHWFQNHVRLEEREDKPGVPELRGLSVDVTELKSAEERAREAVRFRDEFMSIASHELKTPLTALKLQTQILFRTMPEGSAGERLKKCVQTSERQVRRLETLVEQLLDISRINNGKLLIDPEVFDLIELSREVQARFGPQSGLEGFKVTIGDGSPLEGKWDRFRIDQVLTNLLTNAFKYGDSKPVELALFRHDGETVAIEVRDKGIGIAPEDRERIFSQFERAVSTRNFSGLGLGLFIVRQIVEAHRGRIEVESELGKGSVFRVLLPTGLAGSAQALTSAPAAPGNSALDKPGKVS